MSNEDQDQIDDDPSADELWALVREAAASVPMRSESVAFTVKRGHRRLARSAMPMTNLVRRLEPMLVASAAASHLAWAFHVVWSLYR